MIAASLPMAAGVGAPSVLSAMAKAIQTLYGIADGLNQYLDEHIEEMKLSQNPTVSRTGRVLEMAKFGFGVGYITPVVVIAVGQLLLGNPLAAIAEVATAATLSNPIAMTCAAVGAIYYGWSALSDKEREEILDRLSTGLEVGIEFIRSVVRFVIDKTREVLSSKNLTEFKRYIEVAADTFGKNLGDVTRKLSDKATDLLGSVRTKSSDFAGKTGKVLTGAYDVVVDSAVEGAERTKNALSRSSKPKSPEATDVDIPEATPEVASKVQRKPGATVEAAAGSPEVVSQVTR